MGQGRSRFALALACALTALQAQAADDLIRQGAELVKAGKSKAAYELLEPQEDARAGDKDFDLLFGIAALDVGQNTRAIFALERVLAVDPNNTRARAEIGRAYLLLGETQAAKGEFQNAKKMGVPPEVEQTIDRFLSAVDRVENAGKTVVRGYVEGTIGYDTNVNAGPARGGIAVPAFGNAIFTLDPSSRATEDWFASIGGGVSFSVPVDSQLAIVGGASGSQRWNDHVSTMNLLNVDANLGASYTDGKDVYSLALQANTIAVDNNGYRDAAGYSAQWQHNIDARNQVSAYLQYSNLSYDDQSLRNVNRWVEGASYAHAWRDGLIGFASAYLLSENNRDPSASYVGLSGYGVRLGGQYRLDEKTQFFGGMAYEMRGGKGTDPTFLTKRNDDQWILTLGSSYQLQKNLKLTGQYAYIDQRSSIEINTYDRNILSATVRYDF